MKTNKWLLLIALSLGCLSSTNAQNLSTNKSDFSSPELLLFTILLTIPLMAGLFTFFMKLSKIATKMITDKDMDEQSRFSVYMESLDSEDIEGILETRKLNTTNDPTIGWVNYEQAYIGNVASKTTAPKA
jgi:hypothetical protein